MSDFLIVNGELKKYTGSDTDVTIPNGVRKISMWAFCRCATLTRVNISADVRKIDTNAFLECASLREVNIQRGVVHIGPWAFSKCTALKTVVLPDTVCHIGRNAFQECRSLTQIAIPEGVTHIAHRTFSNCDSLTEVTLPNSITSIAPRSFNECNSLKTVYIPYDKLPLIREPIPYCAALCGCVYRHNEGAFPESRVPELCALIKKHFFRFTEYQTANHTVIEFAAKHRIIPIDHLLNKCSAPNTRAMLLNYANEFKNNNLDNYKI